MRESEEACGRICPFAPTEAPARACTLARGHHGNCESKGEEVVRCWYGGAPMAGEPQIVSAERDEARQAMQILVLSASNVQEGARAGRDVSEDVDLVERAVKRLDDALRRFDDANRAAESERDAAAARAEAAEAAVAKLYEAATRMEAGVVSLLYGETATVDRDLALLRSVLVETRGRSG